MARRVLTSSAPPTPSSHASPSAASRGRPGFAAVLVAVYGIFAISATARAGVQILRDFSAAPVAYSLSLLAALTYIAVTIALVRGGPRATVTRILVALELFGVLAVGTASLVEPQWFPDATVWSVFGQGYGFVPLLLPVVAVAYIIRDARRETPRETRVGSSL